MKHHIRSEDLVKSEFAPPSGVSAPLSALVVGGAELSLMIADREAGYHSNPHTHDCEQLNYVLEGEIWGYVGDEGFRACKGDFFRVPRNAVHWAWVRGDAGVRVFEAHSPGLANDPHWNGGVNLFDWSDEPETVHVHANNVFVAADRDEMAAVEELAESAGGDPPSGGRLLIKRDDLKRGTVESAYGGTVSAYVVGGAELSIVMAERNPGYHSTPHFHTAEQLCYMLDGSMWVFIDDEGHFIEAGDFFRVPQGVVHWAIVGEQGMRVMEAHAPGYASDEMWGGNGNLFDWSGEPETSARAAETHFRADLTEHMAAVEARYIS